MSQLSGSVFVRYDSSHGLFCILRVVLRRREHEGYQNNPREVSCFGAGDNSPVRTCLGNLYLSYSTEPEVVAHRWLDKTPTARIITRCTGDIKTGTVFYEINFVRYAYFLSGINSGHGFCKQC